MFLERIATMGNDSENGQDVHHGGERFSGLKPPTSPMSQRASSRSRALHVDVSRLTQSGATLDLSPPPMYTPLASSFAPDLSTMEVASKVGSDFLYRSQITHPPEVIEDQRTTDFFADFTQGEERLLKAGNICAPIEPVDVPDMEFELGLAVAIACEVLPDTLRYMIDVARYVVVDVQALIRTIDSETGLVGLRNLEETPFYDMLEDISVLKAARNEALYVDVEKVRQKTCLIITEGKNGSRIYSKDREFRVPAFPAIEVDPTGAGDSFLAGFSAGLYQGLPVEQAVLMGNYFGGLAVAQVGIPIFTASQLESIEETRNGVHIEQIPLESRGAELLSH